MEQYEPNDLLIYARVAEAGSFSRAAERMGLPKSTVSRRITQLEDALGERLMLRTTRRLTLTEFGQQLLEHAQQVAAEVEAVKALSEFRQVRPSGRLRVSMPSDFANLLLTDMLAAFIALHPAVSLELDLSPRRVDLLSENFDIAIRMGDLPDDAPRHDRRHRAHQGRRGVRKRQGKSPGGWIQEVHRRADPRCRAARSLSARCVLLWHKAHSPFVTRRLRPGPSTARAGRRRPGAPPSSSAHRRDFGCKSRGLVTRHRPAPASITAFRGIHP